MNILLIAIIVLMLFGHTLSAFLDGIASRIITYVTILLHPLALIPMLILKLPFEAVAILFLASALYYLALALFADGIKKKRSHSDMGGDEA